MQAPAPDGALQTLPHIDKLHLEAMQAPELKDSVTMRSTQLAATVRQYLAEESDEMNVHALVNEILTEAESDERWNLPFAAGEEALWSLVWTAQHLCGTDHTRDLARQNLEPILLAFEQGKSLPAGFQAKHPRGAA